MTKESPCKKRPLPSLASGGAYLGLHVAEDRSGVVFRVLAPHAESVSVCGDFNGWDLDRHPMQRISADGIWELVFSGELPVDCKYKYFLRRGERGSFKADPFGREVEKSPGGASVAELPLAFPWRDAGWLRYRKERFFRKDGGSSLCIYGVDPLWWRRQGDGSPYGYRELAEELIPYVKQMGFTHVELLGVTGGLRIAGSATDALYAPMPLMGSPRDLKALIDSMHEAGVGVILDWNPFFFAASEHGLSEFDGERLFEAEGERGSLRAFDLKNPAIREQLIQNALFWIEEYHADGLSVASERDPSFLAAWKASVRGAFPDVMTLAGQARGARYTLMGSEFGDAWSEGFQRPLAWDLLDQHMHAEAQLRTARENHFYLSQL